MKLNKSQTKTLLALHDIGGWGAYNQLRLRDASASSCNVLIELGLAQVQRIGLFDTPEWRLTKAGRKAATQVNN